MREPTSPTAISICCCSPRSIVRCSGSVRSRGGISPGWPNWPKSSATQGRSKLSRTGCLMPRFCSTSCSTFGGCRRESKWQGPARCAAGWSASSRQPRPLRSWAWASAPGPPRRSAGCHRLCRLDRLSYRAGVLPAQEHSAVPASAVRKPQSVTFYSLGRASIFTVSREGDELLARPAGSESSAWPRRTMVPISIRRRLARSS